MLFFWGKLFILWKQFRNKCISKYLSRIIDFKGGVSIGSEVSFSHIENIHIGNGTYINGGQIVAGNNSSVIIGDNCMISYNVHIRTTTHNYKSLKQDMINQGGREEDIIIGNNVWIGYGVQILPGVMIQDGAVIGAGAVVTHNVGMNEVWGGIPARFIKKRI